MNKLLSWEVGRRRINLGNFGFAVKSERFIIAQSQRAPFSLSLSLCSMATSLGFVSISASASASASGSGGSRLKPFEFWNAKSNSFVGSPKLAVQRKSKSVGINRSLSVCAGYRDGSRGGAGDFVAGFLVGGAVFGTLAYIFAPQIRRSLLNEDEYGFRKAKRPIYYDEGLEKTRETLNAKISQLNSAIDNVSTRLRGGNSSPPVPVESDPEVEATM